MAQAPENAERGISGTIDSSVEVLPCVLNRLRRNYFSHAGHVAQRYGVSIDRLVLHVTSASARRGIQTLAPLRHVGDLIHAAACVDNCELAWADLAFRHGAAIGDVVRSMAIGADAPSAVRRIVGELRRETCDSPLATASTSSNHSEVSLRDYLGRPAMRHWLANWAREQLRSHHLAPPETYAFLASFR